MDDDDRRLRWLLRRGMKELDIMLDRYHAARYALAPETERRTFRQLLETVEDPDLWAWAMGYAAVPPGYEALVAELRVYRP